MQSVGIRELKNHLSEYLKRVAQGEIIVVTDRGKPVAELRKHGLAGTDEFPPSYWEKVARGEIIPATAPRKPMELLPPLGLPPGTAQQWLDWDRADKIDDLLRRD